MRYQKIYVQIWNDEKFIELSEPSKIFFLYLLTSPHSNLIGAFVIKRGYIAEDLKWSIARVDKAIKELVRDELILFDVKVSVVAVSNYLKYNPLENPNQFIGATNIYKTLPKTSILSSIFNTLTTLSERFNKPFEGASKPEAVTDSETEAVTATEKEVEKPVVVPSISIQDLTDGWNNIVATEEGFKKVAKLTEDRRKRIRLRLKAHPESEFWNKVLNKIPMVPFLSGKNDRKWRADFDFLIKNDENALKIYEGKYDAEKR